MSVKTIELNVPAAQNFGTNLPTGTVVREKDIESYPAEAGVGLFQFGNTQPWMIHQILIKLGGQTSYTIGIRDRNDVDIVLFTGGTEVFFRSGINSSDAVSNLIFFEEERLFITSAGGGTGVMTAKVTANQYR